MRESFDSSSDEPAGAERAGDGNIFLLTGSAPGRGHVGEIILRDMVLHIGVSRFLSVALVDSCYRWQPDPAVSELKAELIVVEELLVRRRFGGALGLLESFLQFVTRFIPRRRTLFEEVKEKARGARCIFAVLNNAMIFGLAYRLADVLKLPLVCLVWDPPAYLLQQAGCDRLSRGLLLRDFRKSLRRATRVAVVSREMRSEYAKITDATISILRHVAKPSPEATSPLLIVPTDSAEWVIGFAGSMYAEDAWRALLDALDEVDWVIAGRTVRLRLLTPKITVVSRGRANIEFLGFKDTSELRARLSTCDVAYLPQPFSPYMRDLCEKSFPTKLSEYLSAGVPVFVHAPTYSSLHGFLTEHVVGTACANLDGHDIRAAISAYIMNPRAHHHARQAALETAQQCFSREKFHQNVEALLECPN